MESLRDNLVSEINQLYPKSPRTQIVLEPPRAEREVAPQVSVNSGNRVTV